MALSRSVIGTLAMLVAGCSVTAFDYGMNRELQAGRIIVHHDIVSGRALAPDRYRVLASLALDPAINAVARVSDYGAAFRWVYGAYYAAALYFMLLALYVYFRTWFTGEQALNGALFVGCTIPIALRHHIFAPWSFLEPTLLTLALVALERNRIWFIGPLAIVASLNRETGILVPIALAIVVLHERPIRAPRVAFTAACLLLSIAIFFALRWWRGPATSVVTIGDVWQMNVSGQGVRTAIPNLALLLGISGWMLAAVGFSRAPAFVRRTTWLALFYLPAYALWGYWYEVRLLMTLYPVVVPVVLSAVYAPTGRDVTAPALHVR